MALETPERLDWDIRSPTVLPKGLSLERRRQLFASWVSDTFTGAVTRPFVLFLNLEDYALEAGELNELVLRMGGDLRARRYGPLLLVVTTKDPAMKEVVRSLAAMHDVPIYLAPSRDELHAAVPAVDLTPAQRAVLNVVGEFGRATASVVAASVGSQSAAVGNVLAHLSSAGLLIKAEGSGRVGHSYVHPRIVDTKPASGPMNTAVQLPDVLSEEIASIASLAGRQPGELIAEAWREFMDRHRQTMAERYREMAEMVRRNDKEGLARAATRAVPARARATAPRDSG
jgi:hypothetical protein